MVDQSILLQTLQTLAPLLLAMLVIILLFAPRSIQAGRALKKLTIIPEFNKGNLKFYEVAAFIDNHISTNDTAALSAYYFLNPDSKNDKLEEQIIEKYGNIKFLKKVRLVYQRIESKSGLVMIIEYMIKLLNVQGVNLKIYSKLKENKFYAFNPAVIDRVLFVVFISLLLISLAFYYSEIGTDVFSLLIIMIALFVPIVVLIPYYYAENLKRIFTYQKKPFRL